MSDAPTHYLWCDLETTGLDYYQDYIMEAAFVLTTVDLTECERYSTVIEPPEGWFDRLVENEFVFDMHKANGLLDECLSLKDTCSYGEVEDSILNLLSDHVVEPKKVVIAGSGVALLDWPIIKVQWPKAAAQFDYYTFDIGPVRRFVKYTLARPDLVAPEADENHRATGDCDNALEQARWYKRVFADTPSQSIKDPNQVEFDI